jgi:hypothetical protein
MREHLREILRAQYIGAIVIAYVASQALISAARTIVSTAGYFLFYGNHSSRSILDPTSGPAPYDWSGFISTLATIILELVAVGALLVWLYYEPSTESAVEELPDAVTPEDTESNDV